MKIALALDESAVFDEELDQFSCDDESGGFSGMVECSDCFKKIPSLRHHCEQTTQIDVATISSMIMMVR
jgi:hypothetical protein